MTNLRVNRYYYSNRKKFFDFFLSIIGIIILFPSFSVLFLILYFSTGSPIIFKQKRMGKNKKSFTIYKIRTMKNNVSHLQKKLLNQNKAPFPMFKIDDDPRFTKVGKYLSHLGIDELPQLFNILIGNMSFIGPRPLPIKEAKLLDSSWDFRYEVLPGILSEWALSKNRYKSLNEWKKLEKNTIRNSSLFKDILFIYNAIKMILLVRINNYFCFVIKSLLRIKTIVFNSKDN